MRKWLSTARTGGFLLFLVLATGLPFVLPNTFFLDVAILALFNASICVGLNLLIGYAGQISLGHAGFVGIGAYASAVLVGTYGWPAPLALCAGAVASGLLAFAVAKPILRLRGHYLAMATLGLGVILSIVANTEREVTGGPDGIAVEPFAVAGLVLEGEAAWYWMALVLLAATIWLTINLVDSPLGRGLRAVHGSEVAAQACGVDTDRFKVIAFTVSAVYASVVGSLSAHYVGFITPADVGFLRSVEYLTMVVLGGMASTFGAVVGAAILTILPQLLSELQDYEHLVFGLILMLTMIFLPQGIVPACAAFFRRKRG